MDSLADPVTITYKLIILKGIQTIDLYSVAHEIVNFVFYALQA